MYKCGEFLHTATPSLYMLKYKLDLNTEICEVCEVVSFESKQIFQLPLFSNQNLFSFIYFFVLAQGRGVVELNANIFQHSVAHLFNQQKIQHCCSLLLLTFCHYTENELRFQLHP